MKRETIIHCLEPVSTLQNWLDIANPNALANAAVLIPLIERRQWHVLLTKRTDHLNHHPGQVSFPGGRADKRDVSPVNTALRETMEEVGIGEDLIDLAGVIEPYQTVTKFNVVPVVGFVKPSYQLKVDTFEVADVFEVPLSVLSNLKQYQQKTILWKGEWREYLELNYNGHRIWGATAAMLHNLAHRLANKA